MSKPTRAELAEEQKRLAEQVSELQTGAASDITVARIGMVGAVAAVILGGVFTLGSQLLADDTAPVESCMEQRQSAIEMAEQHQAWTNLPEDSPVEEQCAINDWVVDQTGFTPTDPE